MSDIDFDYELRELHLIELYDEEKDAIIIPTYGDFNDISKNEMNGDLQIKYSVDTNLVELSSINPVKKSYTLPAAYFIRLLENVIHITKENPEYIWYSEDNKLRFSLSRLNPISTYSDLIICMQITENIENSSDSDAELRMTMMISYNLLKDNKLANIVQCYYSKCVVRHMAPFTRFNFIQYYHDIVIKEEFELYKTEIRIKPHQNNYHENRFHIIDTVKSNNGDEKIQCNIDIDIDSFIKLLEVGSHLSSGIEWGYDKMEFLSDRNSMIYLSLVKKQCKSKFGCLSLHIIPTIDFLRIEFDSKNVIELKVENVSTIIKFIEYLFRK